ncbi:MULTISPECIES: flagellin [Thalassospira]|uniref:Flagellin n=2 Tax=Thalassospira TaxID=168934 RepID=A0AB72U9L6_9PROT|nr:MULTISPECIES: flagellin [Thalassospira]AJD50879.1 flagellin domain-containing protein [Thalassospira xiamenensis M-5 = DSM 17429]KEO57273.1 flagellin [Thalassospira permensis NBRC 106175]SIT29765.1 flagellin [Thalassospira xiamenensis M-5 = DSM 17429]
MGLGVISNYAANVAHRNLVASDASATNSLSKLSSGKRVMNARDDAASMAIGARLNAEVGALKVATTNASQAGALLQVMDGGMSTINDILVRVKQLAVQAGSENLGTTERGYINNEAQSLLGEVTRIANDTEFNGVNVLNDATVTLNFKVGTGATAAEDDLAFTLVNVTTAAAGLNLAAVDLSGADATNANTAIPLIDAAINALQTARASVGVNQNRLEFAAQNLRTVSENSENARSVLIDLDVASEMAAFSSKQVLMQSGIAMLGQANQMPQNLLRLLQ